MTTGFIGGKFLPLHLGHVYAIVSASNQCDELYVVLSHSKKRDKELCVRDGIKYMPYDIRLSWLGELTSNMENVKVIDIEDKCGDLDYDWEDGAAKIKAKIGKKIDCVFSSEQSYESIFNKLYPESKHIIVDCDRANYKISATEIRRNLYDNWNMLPVFVKTFFTKKIVVVGTESCGKSTLVRNLAKVYNTSFVEEYGRTICEKYNNQLTDNMFSHIAYAHKVEEYKQLQSSNKLLFIDSEVLTTKYYYNMYMDSDNELYETMATLQDYDLWLYLEPDVKWVNDGIRFQGEEDIRQTNNKIFKNLLLRNGVKFESMSGTYQERFMKSIKLINEILKTGF